MWDYTFGHQILAPYDFALSVQVAVKEFAPDVIILPGPGDTLGGAIAQSLSGIGWQGLTSQADFMARPALDPLPLSMGPADTPALVLHPSTPANLGPAGRHGPAGTCCCPGSWWVYPGRRHRAAQ